MKSNKVHPYNLYKLLILLVLTVAEQIGFGLSLDQLPAMVHQGNSQVKASAKDLEAAQAGVSGAQARYFPTVELKNRFTRMDQAISVDLEPLAFAPELAPGRRVNLEFDPPPLTIQDRDIRSSTVTLTQPLYWGGQIEAGVVGASAGEDETRFIYQKEYQNQLAMAYERYFQVQLAVEVKTILQRMVDQLDRIHQIGVALVDSGTQPKLSVMKIEVTQAELKSRLIEAANQEKLARLALRSVLSVSDQQLATLDSPLKSLGLAIGEEQFKRQALEKRDEWGILDAKQKKLDAAYVAQTGGMKPKVYAFGKYELYPKDLTMLEPRWAVGVGIDLTLTSPLTQVPERRRIHALREQVDIVRHRARQDMVLEVEKLFNEATSTQASLKHVDGALGLAEETLRLAMVRFRSGDGSEMELLDATSQVEKLQIQRWQQIATYNSSLIQLCRASGDASAYQKLYFESNNQRGESR